MKPVWGLRRVTQHFECIFILGPGCGKSFFINQLIGKDLLSTKTGGVPGHLNISKGCTQYPLKLRFVENIIKKFEIKTFKENNMVDLYIKHDTTEVSKTIDELNKRNNDSFDHIELILPFNLNLELSFLKNVEFIDLIGVPDSELDQKAHERNMKAIFYNGLDIAFILKRDSNNRGTILPEDLINLNKSDLFKHKFNSTKILQEVSPPKIVSVWSFEINQKNHDNFPDNYYTNNQLIYRNYLMKSLNILSKKIITQELINKLKDAKHPDFEKYQDEVYLFFKNSEFKEIQDRLDAFLYFPSGHSLRKNTIATLNEIILDTIRYKQNKLEKKMLRQLLLVNTRLKNKFYNSMSQSEGGSLFKHLNVYKNSKRKNNINKSTIKKKIDVFIIEANRIQNENDEESYLNEQLELKKNKFVDKICKVFKEYIENIRNYIEKMNETNAFIINNSINDIFCRNSIETFLQENFGDLKKIILKRI